MGENKEEKPKGLLIIVLDKYFRECYTLGVNGMHKEIVVGRGFPSEEPVYTQTKSYREGLGNIFSGSLWKEANLYKMSECVSLV